MQLFSTVCICVRPSRGYTELFKNEMSAVWNGDVGCLKQKCQLFEIESSAIWNKAVRPTLDVRPPNTAVWKQSCQTHPGCQTSQNCCLEKKDVRHTHVYTQLAVWNKDKGQLFEMKGEPCVKSTLEWTQCYEMHSGVVCFYVGSILVYFWDAP